MTTQTLKHDSLGTTRLVEEADAVCIERDTLHYQQQIALKYADLVYYGQWFHPLRVALDAFVDNVQQRIAHAAPLLSPDHVPSEFKSIPTI